jgi:hypothetical protein
MRKLAMMILMGLAPIGAAQAGCQCLCSGGENRPFCTSTLDVAPICPPRVCPIAPPSIAPIQTPRLPPLGTSDCRPQQILNPNTGRYEWRSVCR